MKADPIAFEAKKDLLIANFGESYLKKHKKGNSVYACSNRMRELARLLIQYRQIVNQATIPFKELLHPKNFDTVLLATRETVGYNHETKYFKTPSLAMHLGTSLKLACDELAHLILKESNGFRCKSNTETQECLKNVKNFKKLVETRWNTEIASLANKDLVEKKWSKPLLLPLVNDIKIFREECLRIASACNEQFLENKHNSETYSKMVQCVLALLIIFNRRRIGDVQFLKITEYNKETGSNFEDFHGALSETEKMLATKYKRVVNSGKGSREVVILIPKILQNYIDLFLKQRGTYISPENEYVFAMPNSKIPWGKGDLAIRTLAKGMKLQNPKAITSNKLRKHIATVTQILNLTKEEAKQFSTFMGHTEKTHQEFYELPIDIYQTAKISKLLILMEKGALPKDYKGKSLAEINFDEDLDFALESDNDDEYSLDNVKHYATGNLENKDSKSDRIDRTEKAVEKRDVRAYVPENVEDKKEHHFDTRAKDVEKKVLVDNLEETGENRNLNTESIAKKRNPETSKDEICKKKRKCWSTEETVALSSAFKTYLQKHIYPTGDEIKAFLNNYKIDRTVAVVKAKLQHLMKQM